MIHTLRHIFNFLLVSATLITLLFCGCKREPQLIGIGLDDSYRIPRMQKLILHSDIQADTYLWECRKNGSQNHKLTSTDKRFLFCTADTGTYSLTLTLQTTDGLLQHNSTIIVEEEQIAYSPYIQQVVEYRPAPGQFINTMPEYEQGDTEQTMLQKATLAIAHNNGSMVCLGSYGGYLTFRFDHTVVNIPDSLDFYIRGNAFFTENKSQDRPGGACEPGIVMVSIDENENGLPDDIFYELAGSEYGNEQTKKNYSITYQQPATDTLEILWTDNYGDNGKVARNPYHQQAYFPKWINEDLTFTGTCLPKNAELELLNGFPYFVLYAYDWGYADNAPNDSTRLCSFNIDWAVDEKGNKVKLPCADFIRVYTGVNQQCGSIGEVSTEISGATDMHL
ncbi:MAG: cell surface protein [Paludibacteraceae bacterium]|nr:cell surface protein [Paludibacteraceae bacterium]